MPILEAVAGFALGLVASIINLGGLWLGIRLFAQSADSARITTQAILTVLACFVKMPVFIAAGYLAWRVGGLCPGGFLAAVFSVYSALIAWVARTR